MIMFTGDCFSSSSHLRSILNCKVIHFSHSIGWIFIKHIFLFCFYPVRIKCVLIIIIIKKNYRQTLICTNNNLVSAKEIQKPIIVLTHFRVGLFQPQVQLLDGHLQYFWVVARDTRFMALPLSSIHSQLFYCPHRMSPALAPTCSFSTIAVFFPLKLVMIV